MDLRLGSKCILFQNEDIESRVTKCIRGLRNTKIKGRYVETSEELPD